LTRGLHIRTIAKTAASDTSDDGIDVSAQKSASRLPGRQARKSGAAKNEDIHIPDKLYFRIGEVARLCRLPAYVLRFWETEFPQLKPTKSSTGQRLYRRRDVENVLDIKRLLYGEGFTIAGARTQLLTEKRAAKHQTALPFAHQPTRDGLRRMRHELKEILGILAPRRN